MKAIGVPELLVLLIIFATVGVPAIVAWKAPPIGNRPYRWGAFLGIYLRLTGVVFVLGGITAGLEAPLTGVVVVAAGVASFVIGTMIARRRRLGGILAIVWLIVASGFMGSDPRTSAITEVTAVYLLAAACSALYFWKRRFDLTPATASQ